MLDFIVIYTFTAVVFLAASLACSTQDCKDLNAELSRKVYRVNYKACFFKSLFFPLTLAKMLYELIKNAME